MKLRDFLTLKSGSGILLSGNVYNPYINYSWSQTLTVGGNQQIKDTGTAGLNLKQFFGQGCWFNGVDNYLNNVGQTGIRNNTGSFMLSVSNITSNPDLKVFGGSSSPRSWIGHRNGYLCVGIGDLSSIVVCPLESVMQVVLNYDNFNYEVYVNNQLKKTGTYTVAITENRPIEIGGQSSSFYVSAVIKDVYMFNRPLTQAEIDKYNNQPNQFFIDSLEDSSCILAMPMCEKDGFVRNYKSYTVNSNNLVGAYLTTDYNSPPTPTVGTTTISNGVITQTVTSIGTSVTYPRLDFASVSPRLASKVYLYEFEYEVLSGTCVLSGFYNGIIFGGRTLSGRGKAIIIAKGTLDRTSNNIYLNGMNLFSVKIWDFNVKEISGAYPINNYTSTCRTNAQRLTYGLQTSGFKKDSLGMILSKSNFLEADGVGYGNTGWVPKWNEDFTVESVFEVSNDSEYSLNGNNYADGIYFGKNSVGKSLYVRVFGTPVILLANSKDIVCLIFSYNWQTKEVKQYVGGVLVTTQLATKTTNASLPVLLGMIALGGTNYPVIKPLRLLKVHNKVLTQEEITKNFNKYQAQGLLNE